MQQVLYDPEMLDVTVNFINIITTGSSFAQHDLFTAVVTVYYFPLITVQIIMDLCNITKYIFEKFLSVFMYLFCTFVVSKYGF